mmetsp:Transcript_12690/g.24715  ORF Transcript_12690/g.24715 Transcript_12690/m.24715 type:complete len:127 (-) Transcript_12690:1709-2089(-)
MKRNQTDTERERETSSVCCLVGWLSEKKKNRRRERKHASLLFFRKENRLCLFCQHLFVGDEQRGVRGSSQEARSVSPPPSLSAWLWEDLAEMVKKRREGRWFVYALETEDRRGKGKEEIAMKTSIR